MCWCFYICFYVLFKDCSLIEREIRCHAESFMMSTYVYTIDSTSTSDQTLYNYAIFLGGTNDLGWGKPAPEIWSSIKAITAIPLLHGSKVLLMTVPECGVKSENLDKKRDELNACIREDGREGV